MRRGTSRYVTGPPLIGLLFLLLAGCSRPSSERPPQEGRSLQPLEPAPAPAAGAAACPDSFVQIAEQVQTAVVNISTTKTIKSVLGRLPGKGFHRGDAYRHFFGERPELELKTTSLGSGFLIDRDGLIVTNHHVVSGAEEIRITLADGRNFKAAVVGEDVRTEVAVVRIEGAPLDLPYLSLGDSDAVRVGQWVLAVGSPFGLEHTVTQGIISATGRSLGLGSAYEDFLQTDAPINPGNSGGPLVNVQGEAVGVNTAVIARAQGIGFAVPSNTVKYVIREITANGKVVRGWIGVIVGKVTPERVDPQEPASGVAVEKVVQGSPAERAGIQAGDLIVGFAGRQIQDPPDLARSVAETRVGQQVRVRILRDGEELEKDLSVKEMPADAVRSEQLEAEESVE
ncbi:MAG: trypsin-like peptidase domain-containing protein [bacterium]